MQVSQLFERVLDSYAGAFDITRGARVAGREVDALAQFRAMNQKYVLNKKHVLWEANAFEHAIFICRRHLTAGDVTEWFTVLTREAEAELIHPEGKYPPEGHMYSYLTAVFLCETADDEALRAVKKLRFGKNYLFSLRGWATGRAVLAVTDSGAVETNRDGKEMKKHYMRLMRGAEAK